MRAAHPGANVNLAGRDGRAEWPGRGGSRDPGRSDPFASSPGSGRQQAASPFARPLPTGSWAIGLFASARLRPRFHQTGSSGGLAHPRDPCCRTASTGEGIGRELAIEDQPHRLATEQAGPARPTNPPTTARRARRPPARSGGPSPRVISDPGGCHRQEDHLIECGRAAAHRDPLAGPLDRLGRSTPRKSIASSIWKKDLLQFLARRDFGRGQGLVQASPLPSSPRPPAQRQDARQVRADEDLGNIRRMTAPHDLADPAITRLIADLEVRDGRLGPDLVRDRPHRDGPVVEQPASAHCPARLRSDASRIRNGVGARAIARARSASRSAVRPSPARRRRGASTPTVAGRARRRRGRAAGGRRPGGRRRASRGRPSAPASPGRGRATNARARARSASAARTSSDQDQAGGRRAWSSPSSGLGRDQAVESASAGPESVADRLGGRGAGLVPVKVAVVSGIGPIAGSRRAASPPGRDDDFPAGGSSLTSVFGPGPGRSAARPARRMARTEGPGPDIPRSSTASKERPSGLKATPAPAADHPGAPTAGRSRRPEREPSRCRTTGRS